MYVIPVIACIILIAADQTAKYYAVSNLKPLGSVTVIENVLSLSYVENYGASFGLMQGGRWFFVILTVVVLIAIIIYYIKLPNVKHNRVTKLSLVLIGAGAVGNFIDRLLNGFVVDMIHATFIAWPVFNLADIYVVTGTAVFSAAVLFQKQEA